ncbi:four helix bundle protein [Parabacteroides sp. 52]|uniref:four helix bundle protein n=1 Tax=unclassified Parabacteroides TaxID=2649774 RepID=UPI0013D16F97|nr:MULTISPECIES: four helix bundle protein [unclassified Parabacteroides]MDH6534612.1 four helix bundle protein [Parabacteroides sp. PM5-20]NDV55155.1 four helix bundle protein [Parabacteroides sp. 52]
MKDIRLNPLKDKSFCFALRIIKLYKYLCKDKKEMILSKQILRSGTAIGAMQRESEHAESTLDFIHKLSIAQKESNETLYWLELLHKAEYIDEEAFNSIYKDAQELIRMITSIIKSTKASIGKL